MTTVRAPLTTVLAKLRSEIEDEAKAAAGNNTLISKNEQGALKDSVTKATADEIRAAGGIGSTVSVDALVDAASSKMATLIGTVNQATGSGASTVSQAEVKALAAANPDAGVRVARAYELITGKKVDLDGIVPLPVPHDVVGELNLVRSAIRDFILREVTLAAGSNHILSAAERSELPPGRLRDAAFATPSPRTTATVTETFMVVVDEVLAVAGVDMTQVGRLGQDGAIIDVPFARDTFFPLVSHDPEIAGIIADGVLASTGTRPDNIPGLPPQRFSSTTPVPVPVPTPTPVTPGETWHFGDVRNRARDLLLHQLQTLSGGNQIFSAAERAALPQGILFTAGMVVADTGTGLVTSTKIANEIMAVVDFNLQMVGLDPALLASDPDLGITLDQLARLVLENAEIAGLIADAMGEHRAPRPEVPYLPPPRFMIASPTPPGIPGLGGPVLNGVPGAVGNVRLVDPALVDALTPSLDALIDAMDYSRNGTITLGEAESFVKRANGGSLWDPGVPPENQPRTVERALLDIREGLYQRFGRSPTTAELKVEVGNFLARAKQLGFDENSILFDAQGAVGIDDEIQAVILFDTARAGGVSLDDEPYVRFFDHEGDVAVAKRRPLDLTGPAAKAVRNLVFHFNKAENDNHWPLWSGFATSRYRLDVDEVTPLIARLKQEPVARQQELFQALVDWLGWHPSRPGLVYVNTPARPLVDALAVELGHAYRSPTGETTAPSMPSP